MLLLAQPKILTQFAIALSQSPCLIYSLPPSLPPPTLARHPVSDLAGL